MSIDEFKKKGSKQLHPEVFADISIRMRSFSLGCTFMVYGFDDNVKPHVFTIANPGRVESFDKPGFWAIGAGARSSLSTLSVLRQHPDRCSVEQTIYNVLAAKYSSESASDVGPETWVWIKRVNCDGYSLASDGKRKSRNCGSARVDRKHSRLRFRQYREAT